MMPRPIEAPAAEAVAGPVGAVPAAPPAEASLHTFELTIWEKAEHWRIYETIQAVSEQAARAQFARAYGRGYRLLGVHCLR